MNKDLLPEFVNIATKAYGEVHKITETDQVICYCWREDVHCRSLIDRTVVEISNLIKEKGWKIPQTEINTATNGSWNSVKTFFTITYGKEKDKISLSRFTSGYGYSQRQGRLHIIRRSEPILCISKHVYVFMQVILPGRRRRVYQPRIYTGWYYNESLKEYLRLTLNCSDEVLKLYIPHRYMKGYGSQMWAFGQAYGFTAEYLIDRLNSKVDYNWLIQMGKRNIAGYCKMLNFRLDEAAVNNITNMSIDQLERPVDYNQTINLPEL